MGDYETDGDPRQIYTPHKSAFYFLNDYAAYGATVGESIIISPLFGSRSERTHGGVIILSLTLFLSLSYARKGFSPVIINEVMRLSGVLVCVRHTKE